MSASSNAVAGTLLTVAQTMISKLDLTELMPLILEQLANVVQFTSASIMLIEGDNLRLVARRSALSTDDAPFVVKLDSLAHVQHVIRSGQPVIIDDTRADGRWLPRPSNDAIRAWLGVPLVVKDQVIGLLNVSATTVAFFNQGDIDILRTFAAFAAITLENARLYTLAQQARAAAEQAALAKAAFLANMSHEIRTPLNAVIGAASLLQGTEMTTEQKEYVDTIHICGDNLLGVINEILDFSKFEAGQLPLEAEPFELHECIEDAIAIVGNAALEKGMDIAYLISPPTPATVVGDQARLRQVLINLLGNAVKFTQQGEVTVMVETQPAPAGAPADAACTLRFAVQDSGIGIARETIPALFEPFAQVDTTRTRKYGGTGLGLAICKRLVELMHGTITVTSEPGVGSTFVFTVQVGVGAPAPALPSLGPNRRALIVGKENRSRACLAAHLQSLGLTVTALDALPAGAGKADVLLLDANVFGSQPDAVGEAWAAQLNSWWPHRILILGAVSGMGDYARQHSFEHYLAKPIKRKTLHKALAEALLGQPADGEPARAGHSGQIVAANGHSPCNGQQGNGAANGQAAPTNGQAAPANGQAAAAPLHILLAEDNLDNQRIIERMVKKLGHKVDLVANGRQAAEAATSNDYDVVLMDLHMPEMDGLEATRLIRQMPQHRTPRIVALTADAMLETQQSCQAVGMDGCLCKPLKLEQLNRMLHKLAAGQ